MSPLSNEAAVTALREARIKNQLCWLKRIPHPLVILQSWRLLSVQTSAQTNTTKWDMIDHCTATIISSVSTIPFSDHVIKNGSNRSLKTCQNRVGSRGHAFTYSQTHPVVSFGVFTSYHKSKNLCQNCSAQTNRFQFSGIERPEQMKASRWWWSHLAPVNIKKVQFISMS